MKIHEYQAKEILRKFGVTVPEGKVAITPDEAFVIAKELGGAVVIKAQIHAGGRGKGGGIKVAKTPEEARDAAAKIVGMKLVTHQTGPAGRIVKKVLVEKSCDIARELYLGMTLDRSKAEITMMACSEGGVEIEEVARRSPEKILKVAVDVNNPPHPPLGKGGAPIQPPLGKGGVEGEAIVPPFEKGGEGGIYHELGYKLGLNKNLADKFAEFAGGLCSAYIECDCSLAEINPLVVTKKGDLLALDAKINLDDNALFRHPEFASLLDPDEEDPMELEAKKHDLNYVSLDGNIGCMVNGAGLAMATMDIIKLYGGEPANFLDVGGGATRENVAEAFKIILHDPKVKAILINIFGGIVRCDMVAEGIVAAAREIGVKAPLVVRLQGTNVEAGRRILAGSGMNIVFAEGFADGARLAVKNAK